MITASSKTHRREMVAKEHHVAETGRLWSAYQDLQAGRISRRDFLQRAAALGVATPVALGILRLTDVAQEATPASGAFTAAPTAGTEGQTRGAGGELKLLQWQAPTTLSPHTGNGTKDYLGASLILEPLMSYLPDATVIPTLVDEVPSIENGGLSEDLTTVTYKIKQGVTWSDGEPFTSKDVLFTWQW